MESSQIYTPKYHTYLKWAFLASLVFFVLHYFANLADYRLNADGQETRFLFSKLVYNLKLLCFWCLLGLSINKLKECLIAFSFTVLLVSIPSYFINSQNSDYRIILFFLKYVPFVIFGALIFHDNRKYQVLWMVIVASGVLLSDYGYGIFESLNHMINGTWLDDVINLKIYRNGEDNAYFQFNVLRKLIGAFQLVVSFAASAWFLDRLHRGINPIWRSLDLRVNYTNIQGTLIFICSKWVLLIGGLSIGQIAVQRGFVSHPSAISDIRYILLGAESILGLFAVAAFFRCFLAEYLLSRNYKVGWHFFWLIVPLIGEIVWLVCLLSDKTLEDVGERYANYKKALGVYPESLKMFILIVTGISIFISVATVFRISAALSILTLVFGVLGFALLILYFMFDKTVYWIIGLVVFFMAITIVFKASVGNVDSGQGFQMTNISNVVIFMVIFHLKSFTVYPEAPKERIEISAEDPLPYILKPY